MAEERSVAVYQSRDGQEIKLSFDTVRKYLVSGKPEYLTDQEMMLFIGMCKARGLNPFKRDCYLIKYTERDPAATIVSIDYFRSRAKAMPDCVGWKSGIILLKNDGQIEYREGSFMMDKEELVGGWFRGKPANWVEDYFWTVPLAPYIKKTAQGNVTQFWQEEKQSYMIAKVAESQGLRRLWPDEFQGLFVEGEIQPTDITPPPNNQIKVPQPLPSKEKADAETTDAAGNSGAASTAPKDSEPGNRSSAGVVETQPSTPPVEGELFGAEKTSPPEGITKKQTCLNEIAGWSKDTFQPASHLNVYFEGMAKKDRDEIVAAYNARKKELGL